MSGGSVLAHMTDANDDADEGGAPFSAQKLEDDFLPAIPFKFEEHNEAKRSCINEHRRPHAQNPASKHDSKHIRQRNQTNKVQASLDDHHELRASSPEQGLRKNQSARNNDDPRG